MNEERMRILEMVRDGKISAEEGVRLLEALQPKSAPKAGGDERDDPIGVMANAVAQAFQSGDWRGLMEKFSGSWSSGPLRGLEKRRERETEGWEFLTLSDGNQGTFELPDGAELSVEHESGSVEAVAGDGPARVTLEGEGTHSFAVYVARKDKEVVIACHRTAPFAKMPRLRLSIPQSATKVSLRTAGGSLTAESFSVPVHLKTAGGSIRVREQRGAEVTARTAGGSIKVDGTPARIDLHTSGGSITFQGRTEAIDVKTSGGSINIDGAHLVTGEHEAKTSGGSIRIGLSRESSVQVEARTSAGQVHVDLPGADGEHTGSRISPRYHGRYNGGAARLSATTAAGAVSISLTEPGATESAAGEEAA